MKTVSISVDGKPVPWHRECQAEAYEARDGNWYCYGCAGTWTTPELYNKKRIPRAEIVFPPRAGA